MRTILLIDGDPVFRSTLAQLLLEHGWAVLEAEDLAAGIPIAKTQRPGTIVCPIFDGGEALGAVLRACFPEGAPKPRLILLSHSPEAPSLEKGLEGSLILPYNPHEIVETVQMPQTEPKDRSPLVTRLKFWGVRGSIPTPGPSTVFYGGNTSCIEIRCGSEIVILDAGSGIRPLGLQLVKEFKDVPISLTLLITHTHWDHIQGFPFFIPAYNPKNRLRILGFDGARKGLLSTLSGQMETPYFPISLQQMPGNIIIEELEELQFQIGSIPVQAAFMNHPGICVGYRLFTPGGSISYLPDNELGEEISPPSEIPGMRRPQVLNEKKLLHFIEGSEILIFDSQYDASEYHSHRGWGHSSMESTIQLALKARVKKLFLFHHDPTHDDDYIHCLLAGARELISRSGGVLEVEAAREGLEILLPPLN
jgi:phosphoribosyl 1,2-cyclic phosphodiesterase